MKPDPDKVQAIVNLPEPVDVSELRCFMGMVNQLGKFIPNLAEETKPLQGLLSTKSEWLWDAAQTEAYKQVKTLISSAPTLKLYDPQHEIKATADASSFGLGAMLSQKEGDIWKPTAFASRLLTPTEQHYAQIEKETLASAWACEKFSDFLIGKQFLVETDHKPLIPLLGTKDLDQLPIRVQRFKIRLMRFTFNISHVPGKELYTSERDENDETLQGEVTKYVNAIMNLFPVTDVRMEEIKMHSQEDETCQQLMNYCNDGWPEKHFLKGPLKAYQPYQSVLSVQDGILMFNSRILVPSALRLDMLERIHTGHQGIHKCRQLANQYIWWPGMSQQIEDMVKYIMRRIFQL